MKCRYIDDWNYCRHKKNSLIGHAPMKCVEEGCPYNTKLTKDDKIIVTRKRRKYIKTIRAEGNAETKRHRELILKKRSHKN